MTAYVFLAGDFAPGTMFESPSPDDMVVAVDGGYLHLRALGLWPKLLVGDFDSIPEDALQEAIAVGVETLRWPVHKDYSDAELAIDTLHKQGYTHIVLYGALGGERFDHALANVWSLYLWKERGVNVEVRHQGLHMRMISNETVDLCGKAGDIVSLLPFSPVVHAVTIHGFRYPLVNATLHAGESWSLSNEMACSRARIMLGSGMLAVLHQHA